MQKLNDDQMDFSTGPKADNSGAVMLQRQLDRQKEGLESVQRAIDNTPTGPSTYWEKLEEVAKITGDKCENGKYSKETTELALNLALADRKNYNTVGDYKARMNKKVEEGVYNFMKPGIKFVLEGVYFLGKSVVDGSKQAAHTAVDIYKNVEKTTKNTIEILSAVPRQVDMVKYNLQVNELMENKVELESKFNDVQTGFDQVQKNMDRANVDIKELRDFTDENRTRIITLEKKTDTLDKSIISLDQRVTTNEQQIQAMQTEISNIDGRVGKVEGAVVNLDSRMQNVEGVVVNLDGRLQNVEHVVLGFDGRMRNVEGAVVNLDGRMQNVEHNMGVMQNAIVGVDHKIDKVQHNLEVVADHFDKRMKNAEQDIGVIKKAIVGLDQKVDKAIDHFDGRMTNAERNIGIMQGEIVELGGSIQKVERNLEHTIDYFDNRMTITEDRVGELEETSKIHTNQIYSLAVNVDVLSKRADITDRVLLDHQRFLNTIGSEVSDVIDQVNLHSSQIQQQQECLKMTQYELGKLKNTVGIVDFKVDTLSHFVNEGFEHFDKRIDNVEEYVQENFQDVRKTMHANTTMIYENMHQIVNAVIDQNEQMVREFDHVNERISSNEARMDIQQFILLDHERKIELLNKSNLEHEIILQSYGELISQQQNNTLNCMKSMNQLYQNVQNLSEISMKQQNELDELSKNQEINAQQIQQLKEGFILHSKVLQDVTNVINEQTKTLTKNSTVLAHLQAITYQHSENIGEICKVLFNHEMRIGTLEKEVDNIKVILEAHHAALLDIYQNMADIKNEINNIYERINAIEAREIEKEIEENARKLHRKIDKISKEGKIDRFLDFLYELMIGNQEYNLSTLLEGAKLILGKEEPKPLCIFTEVDDNSV